MGLANGSVIGVGGSCRVHAEWGFSVRDFQMPNRPFFFSRIGELVPALPVEESLTEKEY